MGMTGKERHLYLLDQGIAVWNQWREENRDIRPNLNGADLTGAVLVGVDLRSADLAGAILVDVNFAGADLTGADLTETNLCGADLTKAILCDADLSRADMTEAILNGADLTRAVLSIADLYDADLTGVVLNEADLLQVNLVGHDLSFANLDRVNLTGADLSWASLRDANLRSAVLREANLSGADLSGADLNGADLVNARLVGTNFTNANLTNCRIYGISAWELRLDGASQSNLIITPQNQPIITVDNLEVAQFIYLLLHNEKIRDIIDTIATKVVLILGCFTTERKAVLDAIRGELRRRNYLPVLFDFDKPASRDFTETVRTLAHLARFIIADITEPRSIPQELQAIVPDLAVPVQPLLLENSTGEYGMFQDFPKKYHWVLAVHRYRNLDDLLASLGEKVIAPAEAKAKELEGR